jgi:hypothetical protein
MPQRSNKKRPVDINHLAKSIVDDSTNDEAHEEEKPRDCRPPNLDMRGKVGRDQLSLGEEALAGAPRAAGALYSLPPAAS